MLNTLFFYYNLVFNDLLVLRRVFGNCFHRFCNLFAKITMNPM